MALSSLNFPVIFLLSAQLGSEELQNLEEQIPTLTYDINEADVVLGKVFRKERALFELRKHKLVTDEVDMPDRSASASPVRKRARLMPPTLGSSDIDSDTASEGEIQRRLVGPSPVEPTVKVVKLTWFTESVKAGKVLPVDDYVVYEGRKVPTTPAKQPPLPVPAEKVAEVLKRALADAGASPKSPRPRSSQGRRGDTYLTHPVKRRPALLKQTTSEHEIETKLPPIPGYLHTTYSCQRPTPTHPPNKAFIEELSKIRTARTLLGDKIGVRAYSTAIAAVAAYPYTFQSPQGRCPRSVWQVLLLRQFP
jgi:DNA polymerase IV